MRKVRASYGCLLVTLTAVVLMALASPNLRVPPVDIAAKVEVCEVATGSIERLTVLSGRVRYETEYAALAPADGLVESVYVTAGQSVTAGQALFRLNGTLVEAAVSATLAADTEEVAAVFSPDDPLSGLTQTLSAMQSATTEAATFEAAEASRASLENLTVRAQTDGTVQQVNVARHGGVTAGTAAVLLTGDRQQIVATAVPRDAEKLLVGQKARILSKGVTIATATVADIAPAAADTLTGQVSHKVTLCLDEGVNLPLGADVEAEIILLAADSVPVVPLQALTSDSCVWWVGDGRAWSTPVTVLAEDEVSAWVQLDPGTRVVLSGQEKLDEGQRVKEVGP